MADRERDEDTGRFGTEYDDVEFRRAVRKHGPRATTGEVAGEVGCTLRVARLRLFDLEAAGELEATKLRGAYLWSVE